MVEITPTSCPYDNKAEMWSHLCSEVPHGCVAKFSVRTSTAYRWSQWSDESDDVQIVLPPPRPGLPRSTKDGSVGGPEVEIKAVTDNSIDLVWDNFSVSAGLSFIQYRITVCQIRTTAEDPDWSKGHIAGSIVVSTSEETVSYTVKGLIPDSLYMFKVDARYPYIGEHGWAVPATTSKPLRTLFPDRANPYAPVALAADDVEVLLRSDPAIQEQFEDSMPAELPQLVLLIEKGHIEEYEVEYALSNPVNEQTDGTSVPQGMWLSPHSVVPLGIPNVEHLSVDLSTGKKGWMAMGVLFSDQVGNWNKEAIVCRLRHKEPASVSPLLWAGSASEPLVPFVSSPGYCTGSMRYCCEDGIFKLLVRFYLGTAPPSKDMESLQVLRNVGRVASAKAESDAMPGDSKAKNQKIVANVSQMHKLGHRYATHVQMRYQKEGEEGTWITLRPQLLPSARPAVRDADQGPIPSWRSNTGEFTLEQASMVSTAALVWDAGDRFEAWLTPSDGLEYGNKYAVQLRIGTPARWSEWTSLPGPLNFHIPAPRPQDKHGKPEAMRLHQFPDTTTAIIKVPPFVAEPDVGRLEYVVTATPHFEDDWKTVPKGQRKKTGGNAGGPLEGGAVIEKPILVSQQAIKSDVQVVQQLVDKRLVQNLEEIPQIVAVMAQETDAELEMIYGDEMKLVDLELTGLLPATKYSITVSARVPHISDSGEAPLGPSLNAMMETLPGAPPPPAPVALPVPTVAGVGASDRAVFLEFDDRAEYVLEYRAVMETGALSWYPHPSVQGGSQKAGKWWSTQEGGEWQVVPLMHQVPSSAWPKGPDGPKKRRCMYGC
jgi:hypothetical protein